MNLLVTIVITVIPTNDCAYVGSRTADPAPRATTTTVWTNGNLAAIAPVSAPESDVRFGFLMNGISLREPVTVPTAAWRHVNRLYGVGEEVEQA